MKIKTLLFSTLALGSLAVGAQTADAAENITVKSGDTLSEIAKEHKTSVNQIAVENDIENVHIINVGQKLVINDYDEKLDVAHPTEANFTPVAQYTEPVQEVQAQPEVQYTEPVQAQPVVQEQPAQTQSYEGQSSSAKEWIAMKESTNNYNATNGRYIGKYQLDASYLNGDHSPANQERVADQYVAGRYGSWEAAKQFWLANGWY